MNQLYPVFIKLAGRPCLVVGGGQVALQKTRSLLEAGALVTVVSPDLAPELEALRGEGRIRWVARRYAPGDLEGMLLCIAAVDDPAVSAEIHREAEARGILLNAVDHDPHCSFHVPAVAVRGDIKVAVSTGGKGPAVASLLRDGIARGIDEGLVRFLSALGELRQRVLARHAQDPERRRSILLALARAVRPGTSFGGRDGTSDGGPAAERGKVYLVGAGPGDPGLLTLRGARLIATADLIYHDRLTGPGVLALIPASTPLFSVGKDVGSPERADTGELLVEAARAGKAVVRLKGGDPHVFGRGGEEMLALLKAGVPFEVVPGVSALSAVPAAAGIPITFRGLAREVVVRSGYRQEEPCVTTRGPDGVSETTYLYLMTVGRLTEIVEELLAEGLDPSTPAAIVQRGTLPDQQLVEGTLGDLVARTARAGLKPPAMVIVGEVVRFLNWKENLPLLESQLVGGMKRLGE